MLITLKTGYRDLHRIGMEQAANLPDAVRYFRDAAFRAMSERHHQEFFHFDAAEPERRQIPEFFAYETIGVAIMDPRAIRADFS